MTEQEKTPEDQRSSEEKNTRTWVQEIEIAGEELIGRVKELAADSRVKRIRVVEPDGDIALEIPLAYGAIAGGAVVIAAPVLAVVGALAALVAKVKVEIVHEEEGDEPPASG